MYHVRVTAPDGGSTTHPFNGTQCAIGRDASNDIVLTGTAVSSLHCMLELTPNGCVLKERGSTNGTWLNNARLDEPTAVTERDRIFVGSFLIELTRVAPQSSVRVQQPAPVQLEGPILRTSSASDRAWRELLGRYGRYADDWDRKGRPATLALSRDELGRAHKWLKQATGDRAYEVTSLTRDFIAASEKVSRSKMAKQVLLLVGGLVLLAGATAAVIILWPASVEDDESGETELAAATEGEAEDGESSGGFEVLEGGEVPVEGDADVNAPVEHTVIPFETIGDIARRYGVTEDQIAKWNYINPDEPNLDQRTEPLKIMEPTKRPLPQQKIEYEVEKGEASWTKLAERFDVPATRLEKYNQDVKLEVGATIAVWVDPKPYEPRDPNAATPVFDFGEDAVSVGTPGNGHLRNGKQIPARPELYQRKSPWTSYGSSFTLKHLSEAIAKWRNDVAYDGELILSDISKKGGGRLEPHKSHTAGRDIDIWLPTIKGVYKTKYLKGGRETERRPLFAEVDWYALWGLIRALIETGSVQYIFLDWVYQPFVYRAAANMGATEEQLRDWIQWPQKNDQKAIFRHSADHLSHIHVRFKCAPYEKECSGPKYKGRE